MARYGGLGDSEKHDLALGPARICNGGGRRAGKADGMRAGREQHGTTLTALIWALTALVSLSGRAEAFEVTGTSPVAHSMAVRGTAIAIDFDAVIDPATVTANAFRVFASGTGPVAGAITYENAGTRLVLTPAEPFVAGELVHVNLAHAIATASNDSLRAAGFAFSFLIASDPATNAFTILDTMSNRTTPLSPTQIYGANACDLNDDGWLDLATVNESSADVRVSLSAADGTGLFGAFLAPSPIGVNASPNTASDFDGDGAIDLAVSSSADTLYLLFGAGDGTFSATVPYYAGDLPKGVVALDADGDGDPDLAVSSRNNTEVGLFTNDGAGVFSGPVSFNVPGVAGEYGLAAGDVNNDGITDLVATGLNSSTMRAMLGNGDGTFSPADTGAVPTGGPSWVVVLGDVNGDGNLDAATADVSGNGATILLGAGDGSFVPHAAYDAGGIVVSVDLGDLDGDGDLDLVISSYGAGIWRIYDNDGAGNFTFQQDIFATSNPSCAILFDFDHDGDLDMVLTDEIADELLLAANQTQVGVAGPALDDDPGRPPVGSGGQPDQRGRAFASPNPFRSQTEIRFQSAASGALRLAIFDVAGRRVRTLPVGHGSGGSFAGDVAAARGERLVHWNGMDDRGAPVAPGVYFGRVEGAAESVMPVIRLIRLR